MVFRNFTFSIMVGFVVISTARICAEHQYYHAPLSIPFVFETHELPRLLNETGLLQQQFSMDLPENERPRIDLEPIREFNLTLCYGKEWHRYPSSFLIPSSVKVEFIKSEFNGLLPTHFATNAGKDQSGWWPYPQTRFAPAGLNDLNKEQPAFYVRFNPYTCLLSC